MSEVADRYRRLGEEFIVAVRVVPADRWASPSPCEEWTALGVVEHVANVQGLFRPFVGLEPVTIPPVAEDPERALRTAFDSVTVVLDDPTLATQTFDGMFGPSTFESAIDRFACFDLVVHRWDLARATGGDETIDPVDAERVIAGASAFGPALRSPGVCGPEVSVAPDADAPTRMLGLLGRQV
ncbi:MAG: TIGR03086 family metal-binding protein [Acidimicrobiia bacterium]